MLKLLKLEPSRFVVMVDGYKPIYGDAIKCSLTMCAMGIEPEEVELGFRELEENLHDLAHYGVNGCFVFSKNVRDAA